MGVGYFYGVKINKLGTRIVAANHETNRILIVMDITNGDVILVTQFTATGGYDFYRRNLLLLDNGTIFVGDFSRIVKIVPPSTSANIYSKSGYQTIGLQTNSAQNYLHVFSFASSICMITVMDIPTMTRVYQFSAQCTSANYGDYVQTFQACIYEDSSTINTIVFQEDTKLFRIHNQYSTSAIATSTVHDSLVPSLKGKGLHCANNDMVYSLLWGTYSTDIKRIFVAEVNFKTNTITYTRYLQATSFSVLHGVIYASDKFFVIRSDDTIQKTASTQFFTRSPKKQHGIIFSPILTCQAIDQFPYPATTLTVNGYLITATTENFSTFTISVGYLTSSVYTPVPIVSSVFEGQYTGSCSLQLPQSPHDFASLSSTQSCTTFTYLIEEPSPKSIPITPFTAVKQSSTEPVFTYSLGSFSGPASGVRVTAATGQIVIGDIASLGIAQYTVVIEGVLQDCQSIKATFSITGKANTPPSFQGVVANALPEIEVELSQSINYALPLIVDPDQGQAITTIIIDGGSNAYPVFADFTDSAHIKIEPITPAFGNYPVSVLLSDGIATTSYALNIIVLPVKVVSITYTLSNQGPPTFTSPLETVFIKVGDDFSYTLPSQIDPDNDDKISITVDLKQAASFAQYDPSSQKFTFKPKKGAKYSQSYDIAITLADDNINQKKSNYKLAVQIEQEIETQPTKNETVIDDEIEITSQWINEMNSPSSKQKKTHKCSIKIMEVSRNGRMQLKITSSLNSISVAIVNELKAQQIRLAVAGKNEISAKIESVRDGSILLISMQFKDDISAGMDLDYLQVRILKDIILDTGTAYAYLPQGTSASAQIPIQYSPSQERIAALLKGSEEKAQIGALTVSVLLQVFFGFAMGLIWTVMNDLSFIISLGLISIPIPGISSLIQSLLSSIIYMDLLMTDKWLKPLLDKAIQKQELDEDTPLSIFFDSQGFQSRLIIYNLGSTLKFLAIQIFLLLYTGLMRLLYSVIQRAKKQYQFLAQRILWGGSIRFVIQQFQPLIFSSLINIRSASISDLHTSSIGLRFNFYLSLIIVAATLLSIVIFFIIVKKSKAQDNRFSTLIEGLKYSGFAAYWTVWTLLKWSIMCAVLVLLTDYPGQQLQLLLVLSEFSTAFQMIVKPLDTIVENAICLFNEVMATLYIYALIAIANSGDEIDLRENLGLVLMSILLTTLAVNIIKVVIMMGIEIFKKIRRKLKSTNNKVIIFSKQARKHVFEMPSTQNEEVREEIKEEIKLEENVLGKKLPYKRRLPTSRAQNEDMATKQQLFSGLTWAQETGALKI
ncbi:hypothetical protein FGO68_gene13225 [Halteria grandinella]|uniref:TRP C-terminal domain-containing protein n=1 Tax=Halteria grandinella TaxID=5974 RepID=A0A8J8P5M8_HALGN|nr:hypothetical protein FGO68_gene13225 [Halteria grandinella]